MAGARAITECDIKKIIALSTLRQVAVIIFTLGIGMPEIALFHLITHALFKALLFICAGNLIDIHHHNQNLRTMGNISSQLPIITASIIIAKLALCGAPFIAGFYSKDLIIESISIIIRRKNIIIIIIFVLATILTTAYSTRFIIYTLLNPVTRPTAQYIYENKTQINSIIPLTVISVLGGAITNWLIITPIIEPNYSTPAKLGALMIIITGIYIGIIRSKSPTTHPLYINYLCSI